MIQTIVEYINDQIETLDNFKERLGLCEIIEKREGEQIQAFPAQYCGGDEFKRVEEYDQKKGIVYHRLTASVSEDPVESSVGCETNVRRRYPMRTVAIIKKDTLKRKNDDAYIDDKIANNLSKVIASVSVSSLQLALKAEDISIEVTSYNTNRYDVWGEEHRNIEMGIRFDYVYLAINYTVTVTGSKTCFYEFDCDTNITLN